MLLFSKRSACLALSCLTSCSPATLLNATIPTAGLHITRNTPYGGDPRQQLDIYRPDTTATLPVIVFFYGGSWNDGSKHTYPFVAATLARRGNVVVVPDYRLYPQVQFPAFLQDCAQAVAWTQTHLAQLGGNPKRVFLMGHSAGAYNAVMLGLDPHYLADAGTSRSTLAGIIGLAGPYDFLPITGPEVRAVFAPVQDGPASQPITYATAQAPPMLLLAGTADETVRPRNTLALAARLHQLGAHAEDHLYPGVGHIGLILSIAPLFEGKAPTVRDIEAFIAAQ